MLAMSDDRPASVADIVVEELRKKEINGPIRLPKWDFFTRGQKLKVKDPWHILSGYDLEFAGMSTRERVRVMLEWFGRRQTIALPINSVVGCLIATILLMILSENNVMRVGSCARLGGIADAADAGGHAQRRLIPAAGMAAGECRCLALASGHARGAERPGFWFPRGHDGDRLLRGGARVHPA